MIPFSRVLHEIGLCENMRAALFIDILFFSMTTETLCSRLASSEMIFQENSFIALTNGQKRVLEAKANGRRSPFLNISSSQAFMEGLE